MKVTKGVKQRLLSGGVTGDPPEVLAAGQVSAPGADGSSGWHSDAADEHTGTHRRGGGDGEDGGDGGDKGGGAGASLFSRKTVKHLDHEYLTRVR